MSANLDKPAETPRAQLFSLNFIRVVLTLMILMYHFDGQLRFGHPGAPIVWSLVFFRQASGDLAVTLFIMLSGASLMTSTRVKLPLTEFFRRRMLGLLPSYWVCFVAVTLTVFLVTTNLSPAKPWTILLTVVGMDGYLAANVQTFYAVGEWFMGFIVMMYLLFPSIRVLALRWPLVLIAAQIALVVLLEPYYSQWFTVAEIRNPLMRLPDFTFGLIYILYLKKFDRGLAAAAFLVLIWFASKQRSLSPELYGLLLGLSFFLVLAQLAQLLERIPLLVHFFNRTSKLSFGAFLLHHQIIYLLMAHFASVSFTPISAKVLFACVVCLSFGGSALLQRPIAWATRWAAIPIKLPHAKLTRFRLARVVPAAGGAGVFGRNKVDQLRDELIV